MRTSIVIGGVIGVFFLILAIVFLFSFSDNAKKPAFLLSVQGTVQVEQDGVWKDATQGMDLQEHDRVRTTDGTATVVLHDAVVVQMEKDTGIALTDLSKDHPSIFQNQGVAWNSFKRLLGVESYTVTTPTITATVRGTEFMSSPSVILIAEGSVQINMTNLTAGTKYTSTGVTNLTALERKYAGVKTYQAAHAFKELRFDVISRFTNNTNMSNITIAIAALPAPIREELELMEQEMAQQLQLANEQGYVSSTSIDSPVEISKDAVIITEAITDVYGKNIIEQNPDDRYVEILARSY